MRVGLTPLFAFFALALWRLAECGQIFASEPEIDFSAIRKMQNIKFAFKLETELSTTDFIKVVFPFPIHYSLTPQVEQSISLATPDNLELFWREINDNVVSATQSPTLIYNQIDTSNSYSPVYFFQFLDQNRNLVVIKKN